MFLLNKAGSRAYSVVACTSRKPLIVGLIIVVIVMLDSPATWIVMPVLLHHGIHQIIFKVIEIANANIVHIHQEWLIVFAPIIVT